MADRKITKNNDILNNNKNQKASEAFYKTKKFQNFLYHLAILGSLIIAVSYYAPLAEACTCGNEKDTWSYKEFIKNGLKEIFDKMGFFCRNFGKFCSGNEYNALNSSEKNAIDIWNKDGKRGNYFSFLPKSSLDYFCQAIEQYETNKCQFQNILKCNFPNQAIQYCGSLMSKFLQQCTYKDCSSGLK